MSVEIDDAPLALADGARSSVGSASSVARTLEDWTVVSVLALMTLLPLAEVFRRNVMGQGIAGSFVMTGQLTLWVALLGAALAARSERLLALSTSSLFSDSQRLRIRLLTSAIAAGIGASLCIASLDFVAIERKAGEIRAWNIPSWWLLSVLPAGFAAITWRLIWHAAPDPRGRGLAASGLFIPVLFWQLGAAAVQAVLPAALVVVIAATVLGLPVFAAIGGAALLLYLADATPINALPLETYRLTTSDLLPAIPLFALSGYILSGGGASERLTRLFVALLGWLPGGLAIVVTLVLAFFTPLTGASGVTIVSMGGLLVPVLLNARYAERVSLGLVTVSGSIGLLFFPSLPVFMYAFYTNQEFEQLFVGGLLPGVLLVTLVAGCAALHGWRGQAARTPFELAGATRALWLAKWDIAFPFVVLGSIAFGWASGLLEAAAISVLYAVVVECVVHRTLRFTRDCRPIAIECATLVGGFLLILSVALGFSNYLVLADVPGRAVTWVQAHIQSPVMFLLALNLLLIVVGAVMDIYSAIVVIVPLIAPMAAVYGIHPVHLGVIFLANMELGYLMPPMGENLFLSSYRFNKPLSEVYRSTLPYTAVLAAAILVISFVPELTLWLVRWYDASSVSR